MLRTGIVALSCVAALACAVPPKEAPGEPSQKPKQASAMERDLVEIIPPLLQEYNVPGASVAIVVDREILLARGFGVRRSGGDQPVDERTVFQAASLSKPVFAYGVHRLIEEGRLDLDRPLSGYLDAPYVEDPRIHEITARRVLSHSTGFPNWRPGRWTEAPGPLEIEFDPGSRFQYSGEGYVYLQRVVEHLVGEPLDVFLDRRVLEPLGMRDSSFVWEDRFEPVHASPHDDARRPQDKWRPREALASGTLQTTVVDYARFLKALLTDSSPGRWPLGSDAIELILTPVMPVDDHLAWSSGWGVEHARDGNLFWQWGDDVTFKALAAGSRSRGVAVVVLTNGRWGLDVARPIVERVLGADRRFLDFRMIQYRP